MRLCKIIALKTRHLSPTSSVENINCSQLGQEKCEKNRTLYYLVGGQKKKCLTSFDSIDRLSAFEIDLHSLTCGCCCREDDEAYKKKTRWRLNHLRGTNHLQNATGSFFAPFIMNVLESHLASVHKIYGEKKRQLFVSQIKAKVILSFWSSRVIGRCWEGELLFGFNAPVVFLGPIFREALPFSLCFSEEFFATSFVQNIYVACPREKWKNILCRTSFCFACLR